MQYDLTTGQVVKWCPKEGSMLRGLLGALKSNQPAVPLKVCGFYSLVDRALYSAVSCINPINPRAAVVL